MKDVSIPPLYFLHRVAARLGGLCGWLLLALVAVQISVVLARYVLGVNYLWAQEFAIYLHATIFMLAAAWTLFADRHIRIDILRDKTSSASRNLADRAGFFGLLVPMMAIILFSSWSYVVESWFILEGSPEVSGLPGRFLLKSLILVFAVMMLIAGGLQAWRR